jgi:hypothetical protein
MFWYNTPEAARALRETTFGRVDGVDRRSGLRLVDRVDGH